MSDLLEMQSTKIVRQLAKMIAALDNPHKDGKSHQNTYATLPSILEHLQQPCIEAGLAITQVPVIIDEQAGVTTYVISTDGEVLDCGSLLLYAGRGPQNVGSAITYARRYALLSLMNIAGDVDDDGQSAQAGSEEATARKKVADKHKAKLPRMVSKRQLAAIQDAMTSLDMERDDRAGYVANLIEREVASSAELTMIEANKVIAALEELKDMRADLDQLEHSQVPSDLEHQAEQSEIAGLEAEQHLEQGDPI